MNNIPNLKTAYIGQNFHCFPQIGSTNDYCKDNAHGLPDGFVATAIEQTNGKGRLGRQWQSTTGKSLAFSILLKNIPPEYLGFLPLVAGMGVASGLKDICDGQLALKWSNDVLFQNKKLCGILCESRLSPKGDFAVVGIGVNLHQTQQDFLHHDLVYATSLYLATTKKIDFYIVLSEILNKTEPFLQELCQNGFERLREPYAKQCITLGKTVEIVHGDSKQIGTAVDIAQDGALLCNINGKLVPIYSSEASVRGIYGYV